MLTIIPLAVIIISLGIILIVASRHIASVMNLDVSGIPQEREAQLKSTIIEKRFFRKFYNFFQTTGRIFGPVIGIAQSFYKRGQDKIKALERLYKFQSGSPLPDSDKKSDLRIQDLFVEADNALKDGKAKDAEEKYLSILKLNPNYVDAFEGLGKTYLFNKEWGQARETFEHIIKHWPERDLAYASLGQVEQNEGNLEEAKDNYLHALSINNEVSNYHFNLAEVYIDLKENEKAISSLQKAQALSPNNPKILDQLLNISIILKNKSLAQEALDKIKVINPDHGKLKELDKRVKDLS